jgi:hypothetical protein
MLHNIGNIQKLIRYLRSHPQITYYWAIQAQRNYYSKIKTTDLDQPGAAEHLLTFKVFKILTERYKEGLEKFN